MLPVAVMTTSRAPDTVRYGIFRYRVLKDHADTHTRLPLWRSVEKCISSLHFLSTPIRFRRVSARDPTQVTAC